jgi:hypothetical protein
MKDFRGAQRARYRSAFAVSVALALCASAAAIAQSQSQPEALAIPAFFSLNDAVSAGGREGWNELLDGGSVARIVVMDKSVLSDGSGVTGECTDSPNHMIQCLHANGSLVLGYVDTQGACRPTADIEGVGPDNDAGVASWDAFNVDGIFFDNVAPGGCPFDLAKVGQLIADVHAKPLKDGGVDLCNGHECVMTNSSQYPNQDVLVAGGGALQSADFSTTYERQTSDSEFKAAGCDAGVTGQSYFGPNGSDTTGFCPNTGLGPTLCTPTMNPAGWYFGLNTTGPNVAARTAHVVEQASNSAHTVADVIAQSATYHAGFIYVGDQLCNEANGSQYSHLTQYYATLLSSLGATLTIDRTSASTGSGKVTSAGHGINCDESSTEKCKNLIPKNTTLTLTAQPDSPSSSFGGFFSGTTQICNPNNANPPPTTCEITLVADETIVADFANTAATGTLALTKSGPGTGTVTSSPAGISCGTSCSSASAGFAPGFVDLTATPDSGSTFDHFAVAGAGNCTSPCRVTVTANATLSVTAFFDNTLTVTNDPVGGKGNVTSSDSRINCVSTCTFNCDVICSANYTTAATVTLTATATGGVFSRWLGACTGSSPTCQVSMASPKAVTAQFGGGTQGGQCSPGQLPGCCPGDPCRPSGSSCIDVVCGGGNSN